MVKSVREMSIILVGRDSEVTGQWSLFPSQSVIDPPAPSMTGTNERKSYGCTTEWIVSIYKLHIFDIFEKMMNMILILG
jgi:hypothetical protein